MGIASEVRAEMGRRGIKPGQLAKLSGLSPVMISRKVTNERGMLRIDELITIGDALGIPAWELMRRAAQASDAVAEMNVAA